MIGKIIAYMRKSSGMKQGELAEQVGIALSTLSGYETGNSQPNFDMVNKIAEACEFQIIFKDKNSNEEIEYDE